jgi:hypothetical protein
LLTWLEANSTITEKPPSDQEAGKEEPSEETSSEAAAQQPG